jgi:hypothetical protein
LQQSKQASGACPTQALVLGGGVVAAGGVVLAGGVVVVVVGVPSDAAVLLSLLLVVGFFVGAFVAVAAPEPSSMVPSGIAGAAQATPTKQRATASPRRAFVRRSIEASERRADRVASKSSTAGRGPRGMKQSITPLDRAFSEFLGGGSG